MKKTIKNVAIVIAIGGISMSAAYGLFWTHAQMMYHVFYEEEVKNTVKEVMKANSGGLFREKAITRRNISSLCRPGLSWGFPDSEGLK